MTKKKEKIAIIGDGSWGSALALHLDGLGHAVSIWSAFPEYARLVKKTRKNDKYLPGYRIPKRISITVDLVKCINDHTIILFAVPTQFLRSVLDSVDVSLFKNKIFINVAKGIENGTLETPYDILTSYIKRSPVLVLSGPSHAEEVAAKVPTCVVVASKKKEVSTFVQDLFMSPVFRVYTSSDITGLEMGGALKNVIAIAAGMCDGLSFGANTKSALVSRGLSELVRLGCVMGAKKDTFFGLSGLGDLVTTCFSPFGRNRAVGEQLGKGKKISSVLGNMAMVAEGVKTAKSVFLLSEQKKIELPICTEVYKVIYRNKSPKKALYDLMMRAPKSET